MSNNPHPADDTEYIDCDHGFTLELGIGCPTGPGCNEPEPIPTCGPEDCTSACRAYGCASSCPHRGCDGETGECLVARNEQIARRKAARQHLTDLSIEAGLPD